MLTRICLGAALLAAIPTWAQVEPGATGALPGTGGAMETPPPVSGEAYATTTGSESRTNYLRGALNLQTAYDDNVLEGEGATPVSDVSYVLRPTISLDQTSSRTHRTFVYSPDFEFYQHISSRNEADQDAAAVFAYRLSSHATVTVRDSFNRTTNVFNQTIDGVSGSTQPATPLVIAPFATEIANVASAQISQQFSPNGMVGASGGYSILNYPNPSQAAGLADSSSRTGSGFYNLRLGPTLYLGANYQFASMSGSSGSLHSQATVNGISAFGTWYWRHLVSISVAGGPQHLTVVQTGVPTSSSWMPSINASVGGELSRAGFAASIGHTTSGGGSLLGAFSSSSASATLRWQLARTWNVASSFNYELNKSATPLIGLGAGGGHTVEGTALLQHPISDHLTAEFGYSRLHQSYGGVPVLSQTPDSDREYVSISYQFNRALGR